MRLTVREINRYLDEGWSVYAVFGVDKERIVRAKTYKGILLGKSLSSGCWIEFQAVEVMK